MPTDTCANCGTPLLPEQSDFLGSHSQNSDCVAGLKKQVAELQERLREVTAHE